MTKQAQDVQVNKDQAAARIVADKAKDTKRAQADKDQTVERTERDKA